MSARSRVAQITQLENVKIKLHKGLSCLKIEFQNRDTILNSLVKGKSPFSPKDMTCIMYTVAV